MSTMTRAALVVGLALTVVAALILGGCGPTPAPSAAPPPAQIRRAFTAADGQRLDAIEQPLAARPAITAEAARAQADRAVANAAGATAVAARYVALTLENERATHNVWLVTYSGAEFVPSGCTCHVDGAVPNTVVAVDGQTGAVTLIFGADDEG